MVHVCLILSSYCLKKIIYIDLHLVGLIGEHQTNLYENSQVQSLVILVSIERGSIDISRIYIIVFNGSGTRIYHHHR